MFRIIEKTFAIITAILGAASLIGGIVTGKAHCFVIAIVLFGAVYAWIRDDKSNGYDRR